MLPSPKRWFLLPPAFANGSSAKLEESININISILIMPIDPDNVKLFFLKEDNVYKYLYLLWTYKAS